MDIIDFNALLVNDLNCDPNANYNVLHDVLQDNISRNCSNKRVKFNGRKHKKTSWITIGLIKSINFRDKLYRQLKLSNDQTELYQSVKQNLKTYNLILKQAIKNAKCNYYITRFNKYKNDAKSMWAEINCLLNKQKNSNSLPEKFNINGVTESNLSVIVEKFNEHFSNVGYVLSEKIPAVDSNNFKEFLTNKKPILLILIW